MTRRGGAGNGRRGALRGIGSGAPASAAPGVYTPASDPLSLLWWDPTTVSGAVSSWVDKIAGVAAVQATGAQQPTASATALGGAYPGVAPDGGDMLTAAGTAAVLGGKTALTMTGVFEDALGTTRVVMELGPNANTTNGGFAFFVNEGAGDNLSGVARGTTGATIQRCVDSLATRKVVSIGYSFGTAGAGAVAFIRVNGVAQVLAGTSASMAGSAAADSLNFFARAGLTSAWMGAMGHLVFRNSAAQDATLAALETYVGAQAGISI